jgi:hypothetical protein
VAGTEVGAGACGLFHRADPVGFAVHVNAEAAQVIRGPGEVVGVVDADVHVDQAPGGRRDDTQLATAVPGA